MKSESTPAQGELSGSLPGNEHRMNSVRLTQITAITVLALAVCFQVGRATASLDNPVTRPLTVEGNVTLVLNPSTGAGHFTDYGQATEVGLFSNAGSSQFNAAGQVVSGQGQAVAANGDTLDWVVGAPNTIVWTGGTGRFQGVRGGFVFTITSQKVLGTNPDGTVNLKLTYDGTGTITY